MVFLTEISSPVHHYYFPHILLVKVRNLRSTGSWPLSIMIHHFAAYHFDVRAYQIDYKMHATKVTRLPAYTRTRL